MALDPRAAALLSSVVGDLAGRRRIDDRGDRRRRRRDRRSPSDRARSRRAAGRSGRARRSARAAARRRSGGAAARVQRRDRRDARSRHGVAQHDREQRAADDDGDRATGSRNGAKRLGEIGCGAHAPVALQAPGQLSARRRRQPPRAAHGLPAATGKSLPPTGKTLPLCRRVIRASVACPRRNWHGALLSSRAQFCAGDRHDGQRQSFRGARSGARSALAAHGPARLEHRQCLDARLQGARTSTSSRR